MIEVKDLVKRYETKNVIENVTFSVKKGEILGFLGPNGAGKTTTMKIITCFMPQTNGTVLVDGLDINKDSLKARQKIGYLPENCPLYPDMTVSEYLRFVAEAKKVSKKEIKEKIKQAMHDSGTEDVSNKLISKLSKGYRQRVGLAQALVNDPEILILDEPTVGLDPKQIIEIRQLIKNMTGKRTVILSTHILPEVSVTCQRVVIINKGKVVAEDTPNNLTEKLGKSSEIYLKVEAPQTEILEKIKLVKGVIDVNSNVLNDSLIDIIVEVGKENKDIRKELASTIVRNDWGLLEMYQKDVSLEDIFLELVTEEKEEN